MNVCIVNRRIYSIAINVFCCIVSNGIETLIFASNDEKDHVKSNKQKHKTGTVNAGLQLVQKGISENNQTYWDIRCEPEQYKIIAQVVSEASQGLCCV